MTSAHAAAVLAIYQAGIAEGNATFETRAPDWAAFTAARLPAHRFVAFAGGRVAGWVAASAVSGRRVYAGVVEHSVYVDPAARGRGTGRRLLDTLIASTEAAGIWTIQSGIFPENTVSRVPRRRNPGTGRPAPRPLARRDPDRAPQPSRVTRSPGPGAAAAR
jgi:phosphinothricin acetyltransferase